MIFANILSIFNKVHRAGIYVFCIPGLFFNVIAEKAPITDSENLIKIRYAPHWIPQAQFAGFYLAKDRGYYREEGLDVIILQGGPEHPATEQIRNGHAEIATLFLSQAIELRAREVPVVLVAQLLHESSLLLISKKDAGINRPEDLEGRKIAVWPDFIAQPDALFTKFGVQPQIIDQGSSVGILQWRGVDAISAMRYNEYVQLYLMGYEPGELSLIEFSNFEIGFPEDGIYTTDAFLLQYPEAVRGFIRASLRGWQSALAEPEAAIDSVMERIYKAGLSSNRAHQLRMLSALRPLYETMLESEKTTELSQEDFDIVTEVLIQSGRLETAPTWEGFYWHGY